MEVLGHAEPCRKCLDAGADLGGQAQRRADAVGVQDVVPRTDIVEQPEILEHEADGPGAESATAPIGQRGNLGFVHLNLPGVRPQHPCDQVQQRTLAGAARTHDCHRLTGIDAQLGDEESEISSGIGKL